MEGASFGTLLRRLRRDAELTQEALAEKARVSARTIGDIESGAQPRPRRATLAAIAEALKLGDAERAAFFAAAAASSAAAGRIWATHVFPSLGGPVFGRAAELAAIEDAVRAGDRVITLTGVGGVGKTKLALAAAHRLAATDRHVPFFVECDALTEAEAMLAAIATVVAGRAVPDAETAVRTALHGVRALLVVDTLDRIPGAAPALARLSAALPELLLIATSRDAVGVRGERRIPVARLARAAAVDLLVDQIRAVDPGFDPGEQTEALREIVDRLDRLPLAIVLAAPRNLVFGPRGLRDRLAQRLPLLVSTAVDLPERQRTLRATIAWTYELLTPAEQRLFRLTARMPAHFTIEQLERAWDGPGAALLLESLVQKHLVERCEDDDGAMRFGLLGTLAEFAAEIDAEIARTEVS